DGKGLEALERRLGLGDFCELRGNLPVGITPPHPEQSSQTLPLAEQLGLTARKIELGLDIETLLIGQIELAQIAGLELPARQLRRSLCRLDDRLSHRHDLLRGLNLIEPGTYLGRQIQHRVGDLELGPFELSAREPLPHRNEEQLEELTDKGERIAALTAIG